MVRCGPDEATKKKLMSTETNLLLEHCPLNNRTGRLLFHGNNHSKGHHQHHEGRLDARNHTHSDKNRG